MYLETVALEIVDFLVLLNVLASFNGLAGEPMDDASTDARSEKSEPCLISCRSLMSERYTVW